MVRNPQSSICKIIDKSIVQFAQLYHMHGRLLYPIDIPPVLQVCHMSRQEALRDYKLIFGDKTILRCDYSDPIRGRLLMEDNQPYVERY